jgi:eukaryotic-like serine/threonine-protein kinase
VVGIAPGARLACSIAACILGLTLTAPGGLAYQTSRPLVRSQLQWLDRAGKRTGVLGTIADYGNVELSPDGTRLAVAVFDAAHGARDIWLYDVASGQRAIFASNPADENWLIWAPDGKRVIFNSQRSGRLDLFQASAAAGAADEVLRSDDDPKWPVSWSPDGRYILYVTDRRETGNDIWILPLAGDRSSEQAPLPYMQGKFAENWAAFSPDGRWVAYSSTDSPSGRPEVFVASFPTPARRWKISSGGGSQARWRRDGRELFYLGQDRTLMVAAVSSVASTFVAAAPEPLFEMRFPYGQYHAYDVATDGQRFLVNALVPPTGRPSVAH